MPTQVYAPTDYGTGAFGGYYPATTAVWQNWVTVGFTASTTASTQVINPWPCWLNAQTGSSAQALNVQIQPSYASTVWVNWNNGYVPPAVPAPPPTPEELARRERETARNALIACNRANACRLRRKQAERRAEILLLENLTAEQRREWAAGQAFHVETPDGRRRYRIKLGMAGNVTLAEVKGDAPVSKHGRALAPGNRFCMHVYHPDGWVPDADNVLAQKLLLESEGGEAEFLRHANVSAYA